MRTAGSKNGSEELLKAMREAGFLRVDEVASRLMLAPATIRIWASQKKVRSRLASHVRFAHWADCVVVFGLDSAVTLKIVSREEAAKLSRAAARKETA